MTDNQSSNIDSEAPGSGESLSRQQKINKNKQLKIDNFIKMKDKIVAHMYMPECAEDLKIKKTGKYIDNGKNTEKRDTQKKEKDKTIDFKVCSTPEILNANKLTINHNMGLQRMLKLFNRSMYIRYCKAPSEPPKA